MIYHLIRLIRHIYLIEFYKGQNGTRNFDNIFPASNIPNLSVPL